jgi:3D (Asp-Asp-Asp) domain-containing protein
MKRYRAWPIVLAIATATCSVEKPVPPKLPEPPVAAQPTPHIPFTATAYAISGTTRSGSRARRGIVAADPKILPLGSRIRVHNAGPYSGEYDVEDTGEKVTGHIIDIYMPSSREAREFGRRTVQVEILQRD